jgi:hypothetical protein
MTRHAEIKEDLFKRYLRLQSTVQCEILALDKITVQSEQVTIVAPLVDASKK